jgi:protein O-GlcNAc transferase
MRLLGALLLTALLVRAQAGNPDYEAAVKLIESGRQVQAVPLLQALVQAEPKNAQYWKALGVAYAGMGDTQSAVDPFGKACELNQRVPDVCYYFGRALYVQNRFEEALLPLTKAVFSDKVRARAETALAECYEALGRQDEAEIRYREAIKRNDEALERALTAYARFLIRAGRTEESLVPLERALKRNPLSVEAHYQIARAYFQMEKLSEAQEHLERAVQLQPRMAPPRVLLARLYRRLGRVADAEKEERAVTTLQGLAPHPE